jgi:mono/diheme cytochrome c family protein
MSYRAHGRALCSVPILVAGVAVLMSGCMDPHSSDTRGYTKAPLEHAGWVVKGEENGAMRQLGHPNKTTAEVIQVAASEKAPAAAAEPAKPMVLAPGVTAQMVTDGDKLFHGTTCIGCHGADMAGTPMAPSLKDKEWLNLDGSYDEIVKTIMTGVPKPKAHPAPMPPKGASTLTDEEVKKVAAYIYSMSH